MAAAVVVALLLQALPCETGKALFESKSYAAAQEPLWECIASGTNDKGAAHRLALTYREQKNYEDGLARALSEKASQDVLYLLGFLYFRMGRHPESLKTLEQAYRKDKEDWRIHQLFAWNYVVLGVKEGAEASFENAIRLNPQNAELYYQLARFYYSDNRPSQSIAASRNALVLFPDYGDVYNNMALCYEALADNGNARKSYERAIALNQKTGERDEWPYLNYAALLIKLGAPDESLSLLHEAAAINPQSAKAQYLYGRAFRRMGRVEEARSALEKAIQLDASEPVHHFELGMLLRDQGERAAAKAHLDRFEALRKEPEVAREKP